MAIIKDETPNSSEKNKDIIYYHRAYRMLPTIGKAHHVIEFLLLFLLFGTLIFYFFPEVTRATSLLSRHILSFVMPPNTLVILNEPFLLRNFYIIDRIGKFPSQIFLFFAFLVTLLIAVFVPRIKVISKSIGVWIVFICLINLLSCLFFFYLPDRFPYDIRIFSDLYMRTQVTMWFLIALVIPLALAPFPTNVFTKIGVISFILVYSVVFGCFRYIVFFYILTKYSYLFMPVLFFAFGPLIDFVYIVGIYSFFISSISVKMKGNLIKWRWSY